jgi:hypothetical protein
MKLASHLHFLELELCGTSPPLTYIALCLGVQVQKPFYFLLFSYTLRSKMDNNNERPNLAC